MSTAFVNLGGFVVKSICQTLTEDSRVKRRHKFTCVNSVKCVCVNISGDLLKSTLLLYLLI